MVGIGVFGRGVALRAVSSYEPGAGVSSDDLAVRMGVGPGWIEKRTRIESRQFGTEDTLQQARASLTKLLERSEVDPKTIGLVIFTSSLTSRSIPPIAPEIATFAGIEGAGAFDVNAACAGGSYGIELARSAIASGVTDRAVVVASEHMSPFLNMGDPDTAALFGDGSGSVLLEVSEENEVFPASWTSDGEAFDYVIQSHTTQQLSEGVSELPQVSMKGGAVYRWAREHVPDLCRSAIARAGFTEQDIEVFIPHQANGKIIDVVTKQLGFEDRVLPTTIERIGNTLSASVFQAMESLVGRDDVPVNALALVTGFGAGMTGCAQVLRLPKMI
ncbi:3-oxoacyl-ACP synthase III family protein [Rhodococcus qingshengii]